MKLGRALFLFNGQGGEYAATLNGTQKKHALITLHEHHQNVTESSLHTHLAIGLSRGERFDWVLQKATELGVSQITPLFTERTEVKLSEDRLTKKKYSWEKIIQSACEQSGRCILPVLNKPRPLDLFFTDNHIGEKWVLHHRSNQILSNNLNPSQVTLLIGPEGGLSEHEIQLATEQGFNALSLGPRVLRTETAPISALTLIQHYWGDI